MKTIRTAARFEKRAKKLLKKTPQIEKAYIETISRIMTDPFDPVLHTHPLTGGLHGKYACSLTYELRVVFKLHDDIVHLLDIGSHDEVY